MKRERFTLPCGHDGLIIWRSSDGSEMGVRGTRSRCDVCYRESEKGKTPTVHIIRTHKKICEETVARCTDCQTELEEDGWCPKCLKWLYLAGSQ